MTIDSAGDYNDDMLKEIMEINARVESDIGKFSKKTIEREKFENEFYNNQFQLKKRDDESNLPSIINTGIRSKENTANRSKDYSVQKS